MEEKSARDIVGPERERARKAKTPWGGGLYSSSREGSGDLKSSMKKKKEIYQYIKLLEKEKGTPKEVRGRREAL